ncbi:FbpB family small basic protein [Bacillus sp. CFBP9009]
MRKNVSLARLIESNKENINNNQLFIDRIEEKVHKKQMEMQERHLTKQAGEENVIKKSLVITTNGGLS